METDVHIARVEPQPLAVVRRQASARALATVVPDACGTVWNVLRERQVPGAGRNVAVDLDDAIHLEVGVEVDAPFAGHGEVIGSATPAGLAATAVHVGPYDRLRETHASIQRWCSDRRLALAGPSWEIYDHWTDDPAQLRTEVYYLLRDPSPEVAGASV